MLGRSPAYRSTYITSYCQKTSRLLLHNFLAIRPVCQSCSFESTVTFLMGNKPIFWIQNRRYVPPLFKYYRFSSVKKNCEEFTLAPQKANVSQKVHFVDSSIATDTFNQLMQVEIRKRQTILFFCLAHWGRVIMLVLRGLAIRFQTEITLGL